MRAQGRLQEALDALSVARDFDPDSYILRGDLQFELGQIEQAAETYLAVTEEIRLMFTRKGSWGCASTV